MNGLPLDYFITQIDDALERSRQNFTETMTQQLDTIKVRELSENLGELQGELVYLKNQFKKEMKNGRNKKFYQFWK